MSPRKPRSSRLPMKLPSVPDSEAPPGRYDEPEPPREADRVPDPRFEPSLGSRAGLRIRIEELLQRRESPPRDAWDALGDDAREMLIQMLDDEAIGSHDALHRRLIATLGDLGDERAVPGLTVILADRGASAVTKAFAVGALGRIGGPAATEALAPMVGAEDDMLRRQVAIALGRTGRQEAIPHLLALNADRSIAVSEVASEVLRGWERTLGRRLTEGPAPRAARRPRKKSMPGEDR